ncbi:MAG: TonB-dependent receptor [Gammaproteobacteria bacterium]|nr:TonB-dependent receptor [Gammaproteobacteria bacterium]MBT6043632.1 TonB-dependent receptor [Gammaproteobacteria bacterium]
MKKQLYKSALAVFISGISASTAYAQSTLEEITVTAQRRAEDLQSVPVAVTSFNPEELDRLGVTDPQQMADFIPNVSIGDGTGRANVGAQFSIRGVNEARISPVLDPAVGIYIDEVYYGRPITNFLRLLDVQAVEVLRGPQGTLFGKNSTGGAIVYTTIKPDVDAGISGYVKGGFGEYSRANLRTAINIPLSDTLAARVSYSHMERDGWLDRISDGVGLGADDTDFFSAKLRYQPNDQLTVDVGIDYTDSSSNGGASKLIDYFGNNGGFDDPATPGIEGDTTPPIFTGGISNIAAYNTLFPAGTPEHYAPTIPRDLYQISGAGPIGSTDSESTGFTMAISYDISETMNFKAITGYRDMETLENRESDDSPFAESFFDSKTLDNSDFWSQEIQLNGTAFDDQLNYVVGAYISEEEPTLRQLANRDYRNANKLGWLEFRGTRAQVTESTGIFAQGDWMINDSLTLTLGVRSVKDKKNFSTFNQGVFDSALDQRLFEIWAIDPNGADVNSNYPDIDPRGGPNVIYPNADGDTYGGCTEASPCFLNGSSIVGTAAEGTVSGSDTFTTLTPRIALEWQARDNMMFYAAATKGFKSGGTNDTVADINTPFDQEELWNYELGARLQSEDGRIRANITVFEMDYSDKQLTVTADDRCNRRCTINVGDATISGIEIEAIALLTDNLRFNVGYGGLDAEWDSYSQFAGVETDSPFSRAPENSFTAGLRHNWDLAMGGSLISSVNYSYKDDQQSSGQDSTTLTIPSYDLVTARLAYISPEGNWEASLFCNNCTDEEYITGGAAWAGSTAGSGFNYKPVNHPAYVDSDPSVGDQNPRGNAPPGITLVNVGAPRMIGVDFNYSF